MNKDQKRQRRALYNGKRINPTRRANYPKYIRAQHRSTQIHKASSQQPKMRFRLPHNNTGRLQHSAVNISQINKIEN